jgi:hypothetical protein
MVERRGDALAFGHLRRNLDILCEEAEREQSQRGKNTKTPPISESPTAPRERPEIPQFRNE